MGMHSMFLLFQIQNRFYMEKQLRIQNFPIFPLFTFALIGSSSLIKISLQTFKIHQLKSWVYPGLT